MERKFDAQSLIARLRNGEKISCIDCKKGEYITSAKDIALSKEFRCENCGSIVRVTTNDVIVE
jgi:DNA-directed RNA polymerase subunit RPC12/RpoP